MPRQPRILNKHDLDRANGFAKMAKEKGLHPVQLMDLYDVTVSRWQDIASDVLNGFAEFGEDPLKAYNGCGNHLVAESVFACGVESSLKPYSWTVDEFNDRMAFVLDGGSHEYSVIELSRDAAKACGWHYH